MNEKLEKQIADCLGNAKAASHDVEALLRKVEDETVHGENNLAQLRQASLDPAKSPNAEHALKAIQLAELNVARLRNAVPQLEQKLRQCLSEEYRTRFLTKQQQARVVRDAASGEFARVRELQAEIVAIYQEAAEADKLVAEANSDAPAGESRRLLSVELHSRNLETFTRDRPSLMKETRLFDFDTGEPLWPPKQQSMASVFAPVDARRHPGDCSPSWWEAGAAVEEARAREGQEKLAKAERERDEFYGKRSA
jgi:hypothetical protein